MIVVGLQDAQPFVEKRLVKLLEAGVVSALVCMVKQESPALTDTCRECIARCVWLLYIFSYHDI